MPLEPHTSCIQPREDHTRLWRFLDLAKFLDLLNSQSLYFARLDTFEDPYEGIPSPYYQATAALYPASRFTEMFAETMGRDTQLRYFVNSWYMGIFEPAAMWKIYAGEGVAISSTYGRLKKVLNASDERLFLGCVQYKDPSVYQPLNPFDFVMAKRQNFAHEHEVRAFIWNDVRECDTLERLKASTPRGMKVPVALADLIDEVVVSPYAPSWLTDVIKDVVSRYELSASVMRSVLYDPPFLPMFRR